VIGFWPAQFGWEGYRWLYNRRGGSPDHRNGHARGGKHWRCRIRSRRSAPRFLRQQINKKATNQPNILLSDFIAPASTGKAGHIRRFCVTIEGIEPQFKRFEAARMTV